MQVSVNAAGRHVMIPVELANRLGFTAGQYLTSEEVDRMKKEWNQRTLASPNPEPELTGCPH